MYVSKSHHLCICVFKDSDDDFVEIMMFGAWARALPPKPWNLRPCDPKSHQLRTKRKGAHKSTHSTQS